MALGRGVILRGCSCRPSASYRPPVVSWAPSGDTSVGAVALQWAWGALRGARCALAGRTKATRAEQAVPDRRWGVRTPGL